MAVWVGVGCWGGGGGGGGGQKIWISGSTRKKNKEKKGAGREGKLGGGSGVEPRG